MYIKAILLSTLIILSSAWTEEGNVLVLTDDDFPGILQEFSHILIEFYAPWCGHCKKLAPVYTEVADELKAQDSIVRVAKVDATENSKSAGKYELKGYPTLFFFLNGEKIDYSGQRSKESMVNWLLKKTRDPVSQIDKEQYEALASKDGVTVVYHGDFSACESADILNKIAVADDYNTYHWGTDLGKEAGTVELIRNFAESISYGAVDDGLSAWVLKNQRPLVVPFDQRTIGDIFGSRKLGVVLFNSEGNNVLLESFNEAAQAYSQTDGQSLIFTEIPQGNEHIENFANYIKVNHRTNPVILVDAGNQFKYVLKGQVTKDSITSFLENYSEFKYGLTDEVKAEEAAAEEGQL